MPQPSPQDSFLLVPAYEGKRIVLAHSFGIFSPWSVGSVTFGPVISLYITVGIMSLICLMTRNERGGPEVLISTLRAYSQCPNFLPLDFTRRTFRFELKQWPCQPSTCKESKWVSWGRRQRSTELVKVGFEHGMFRLRSSLHQNASWQNCVPVFFFMALPVPPSSLTRICVPWG